MTCNPNFKSKKENPPSKAFQPVSALSDLGPVREELILWAHVIPQKIPGQSGLSSGSFSTQTLIFYKDGSPQRGSEIYSSHLFFLQTVTAERLPRESDIHKSGPVFESIMGAGTWEWNSQEHQSEREHNRWNDEAECEF